MIGSVSQRIRYNVPPFSGEELDVEIALKRYLKRCEVALEGSRPDEEQAFLKFLIIRLHGKASEIADATPLKTVKQLKELLRDLHLKPRDLDSINDEVR